MKMKESFIFNAFGTFRGTKLNTKAVLIQNNN